MTPVPESRRHIGHDPTVAAYTLGPCKRCGHSPDWHTLREGDPTDPEARFSCYGSKPGTTNGQDVCDCPDYVENITGVRRIGR